MGLKRSGAGSWRDLGCIASLARLWQTLIFERKEPVELEKEVGGQVVYSNRFEI